MGAQPQDFCFMNQDQHDLACAAQHKYLYKYMCVLSGFISIRQGAISKATVSPPVALLP